MANRKMRSRGALCVLGLSLILAAAPNLGRSATAPAYDIPAFISLTGSNAFIGSEEEKGYQAVEDYVNSNGGIKGRSIHFVLSDDQSNPQIAVQLLNQAIAAKAPAVFGGATVGMCNAMTPLVVNGPVLYCITSGPKPVPGSFVYLSGVSSTDQISAVLSFYQRNGWNRVGALTSTDATGQDADRTIADILARPEYKTVQLVATEHFGIGDLSVAAQMSRLKAANVQALIIWTTGSPLGTALHGMRDVGLDVPLVTTAGNLPRSQMIGYAGIMPSELLVAAPPVIVGDQIPNGPIKRAIATFNGEYKHLGINPEIGHAGIWDSTLMYVAALRKYGTGITPAQLRDYYNSVRDWPGLWGTFDFQTSPQRGLGKDSLYVVRWDPVKTEWVAVSKAGGR